MLIRIQPLKQPAGTCWQVLLDNHSVTFRTEADARLFADTLQARLQAPHALPRHEQRVAS